MPFKRGNKANPKGIGGFKKGQSGNPGGAPRKGGTIAEMIRAYLERTIKIKGKSGKTKKMLVREAFIQKVFDMAIHGNEKMITLIAHYESGMPKQFHEFTGDVSHGISKDLYKAIISGEYGKGKG